MLVFLLVLWSVGLIGAVLLVIGGRRGGQINQHLLCRRCRFNLSGHNQVPLICPECGRDLAARRATIRGERSPLRLVITIGFLTLVVTSFGLSATLVDLVRPSITKLTGVTKKQLMGMLQDSRRPGEQALAASGLAAAIGVNNIDREDAQQIFAILSQKSIDELANDQGWSNLLIALFDAELLSRTRRLDMIERMSELDCELSTQAWPGYLHLTVGLRPRQPTWDALLVKLVGAWGSSSLQIKQLKIDGQMISPQQITTLTNLCPTKASGIIDRMFSGLMVDIRSLPKGSHLVDFNVRVQPSFRGGTGNSPALWDQSMPERLTHVEQTIELVGPLPAPVMVPIDEVLAVSLQEATTIAVKRGAGGFLLEVMIDQDQLPLGLSGDIVLRLPDDRLIYLGRVQVLPGRADGDGSQSHYHFQPWATGFQPEDHLVDVPVTVEIIPWTNHPMFRQAKAADEPLRMLGDLAVLGFIEPADLRKVRDP